MMDAWDKLGISPTEDKKVIKRAYAKKLREYHPEENPEEFKQFQEAYQMIMNSIDNENIFDEINIIPDGNNEIHIPSNAFELNQPIRSLYDSVIDGSSLKSKAGNGEIGLEQYYYQKFKEAMLTYKDLVMIRKVLYNEEFYQCMQNEAFHSKICDLIDDNRRLLNYDIYTLLYDKILNLESRLIDENHGTEYKIKETRYLMKKLKSDHMKIVYISILVIMEIILLLIVTYM